MARVALVVGALCAGARAAQQLTRGLRAHSVAMWCQGSRVKFQCGEGSQCCGDTCVAPGGMCCHGALNSFPCGQGSSCCGNTCQAPGGKCCANQHGTPYPVSALTPCIHEFKDCTNSSNGSRLCPVVSRMDEHLIDVSQWEKIDVEQPPPSGSLLLYGSSILREWQDAADYWDPLPTLNRAFGGARSWEAVLNFPASVEIYTPRVVVLYVGSNDVNYHVSRNTPEGEAVAEVVGNIELILRASGHIKAQVLVLSVIKAPQKRLKSSLSRIVDGVNAALEALCEEVEHAEYVDLNPMLEDEAGEPLDTIYRPDGLHYWPESYGLFHEALRIQVSKRWKIAKSQSQ